MNLKTYALSHLFRLLCLLLVTQVLLTACASTKSRDDQGPLGKLWHNTNSHYNGYFNADELMTESLLTLETQHVDNFSERLEMFPFLAVDNVSVVKEDLDNAIEKVAIVVKKHPYSNWVDDCYLLVGQAQLIQQDYETAERTLRFAMNEFRPRPKKKKVKGAAPANQTEEEEFVSKREVEANPEQAKRERLRAKEAAQKERKKLQREREKERKRKKKERDRARKQRIKDRKRGIRTPRDTTSRVVIENEPEEDDLVQDLGPVGMISIFDNANTTGVGEAYGKKSGSYVVRHRPAYQEIRLWLAWTYIKRDNFDRANLILEDLRADRGTYPDVRRKAMAVQAYLYLEQDRLEEAITYLEEAAQVAADRNEEARYYFIAGQLHQELNNRGGAAKAFESAIAARPSYDLEIGARIRLAQNDFLSGSGSASEAIARLEKMAKEEKNVDHVAQILSSAAVLALRDGNEQQGGELLRRALEDPSAGPLQRRQAYNLLADLAYGDRNYRQAKLYYDTTLTITARNDAAYADLEARREQLAAAVSALETIETKDSVLRIGLLPEDQRREWATTLFERRRAAAARPVNAVADNNVGAPQVVANSTFWAYQPQQMKRSQRDFRRRWGDRALQDNWRLGNRAVDFTDEGDITTGGDNTEPAMITDDEINDLLRDIPTTEAAQTTTRLELAQAYFTLGKEYRERIGDNEKALEAFNTLNNEYPGSSGEAESWYYQYLINKELGRAAEAEKYAKLLSGKYSGTKFERLANDPAYAAKLTAKEGEKNRQYDAAYAKFEAGDYAGADAMARANRNKLVGNDPLKARYDLLLAMTTGHVQGKQAYIGALQQVVSKYDNTPEQTRAREILRLLGETGARVPGQATGAAGGDFRESMTELHYVIIVFNEPTVNLNEAKVSISKYNNQYAKLERLRMTNVYLSEENNTPVLVMRRFKNGTKAVEYVQGALEKEKEFLNAGEYDYDVFAVSQSNYRQILSSRSSQGYRAWYPENY